MMLIQPFPVEVCFSALTLESFGENGLGSVEEPPALQETTWPGAGPNVQNAGFDPMEGGMSIRSGNLWCNEA
jgi:hypothetical protein